MAPGRDVEEQFAQYLRTQHPNHLAAVFEALKPELLKAARRAGLDEQGAEDVVQETFLGVINAQDRFEAGKPFIPWVRGIAVRQINAERRRRARLQALFRPADARPEEGDLGASELEPGELRAQIHLALKSLSERNRQVVHAALFDGLSIDELSERFNLTKSATSVRLHRGLNQLRERLGRPSNYGLLGALPASWRKVGRVESLPVKTVVGLGAASLLAVVGVRLVLQDRAEPDQVDAAGHGKVAAFEPAEPKVHRDALDRTPSDEPLAESSAASLDSLAESAPDEISAPVPGAGVPIAGVVLQSSGAPGPAGAEVFVLQTTPTLVLPTTPLVPAATTDGGGQFTIASTALGDDPTPLLMVRHGSQVGWADVETEDIAKGVFPALELTPELRIDVSVTDVNGLPVEGVSLVGFTQFARFMAQVEDMSRQFGFMAIRPYRHLFGAATDGSGKGSIRGLFIGESPDTVYFLIASKEGFASAMHAYSVPGREHIKADVTLLPLDSLRFAGRVEDVDGAPLPGAELRFLVRGEAPVSDAVVATTDYSADWSVPHELLGEYPFVVRIDCDGYSGEELTIYQAEDLSSEPYVVTLEREAPLKVDVRDQQDRPLPGAKVTIATEGTIDSSVTDDEGSLEFLGLRSASRRITVRHGAENESLRSAVLSVGAQAHQVKVVLPDVERRVQRLEVTSGDGSEWRFADLVAFDVVGFEGSLAPAQVVGQSALFQGVPEGVWTFSGLTVAGRPCIETLRIAADSEAETVSFKVVPTVVGQADCLVAEGTSPEGDPLDVGDCTVVMRRTDLPGLPDWLQMGTEIAWVELYRLDHAQSLVNFDALAPGPWSAFVAGPGWATVPILFEVEAGEVTRLDMKPVPAGTASLIRPAIVSSGLARLEIRRTPSEPWQLVGLVPFGHDWPEPSDFVVPEGEWLWRATLKYHDERGVGADSFPPTYGTLNVTAASTTTIEMATASIAPPE